MSDVEETGFAGMRFHEKTAEELARTNFGLGYLRAPKQTAFSDGTMIDLEEAGRMFLDIVFNPGGEIARAEKANRALEVLREWKAAGCP